jgi:adenine-specific DNA-methyltransferase
MLVTLAHEEGRAFTNQLSREEQKKLGQFMTPPAIARFMAQRLVADVNLPLVRVLEPAAGAGILAAAVIDELLAKPELPERIELLMFEYDARLIPTLKALAGKMDEACCAKGVVLDWDLCNADFLLSDVALSGQQIPGLLTISNPPFFKLNKGTDERARAHAYAVYGQPNIYSLFMAACARLTPADGRWCFITPRSWMAGQYFKAARQTMLRNLTIDHLHAFESRKEGFEEDAVLQETVIAWARGRASKESDASILLTRSKGAGDLDQAGVQNLPVARVVGADEHAMFSLPKDNSNPFDGWDATLRTYGLEVSTGRVVAFRAARFIRENSTSRSVPLLWLQHVGQQSIHWPVRKKREHIQATAESAWMLVRNTNMVVMRRFSPKEDQRRVTCAAYEGQLPGAVIGLENHLNFIYRPDGTMSVEEVRGLSAFLASAVVDDYFRALAGSTQVNATELRRLPLPPMSVIKAIGARLSEEPSLEVCDRVVAEELKLKDSHEVAA